MKKYEEFSNDELIDLENNGNAFVLRYKEFVDLPDITIQILKQIREYNINNFSFEQKPYGNITIVADEGFQLLINNLNKYIENKIVDLSFELFVDHNNLNQIEFELGIPKSLRNLGLGYKIYKLVIKNVGYITSNDAASKFAKNIWRNLMLDPDLYCYISKTEGGVILKATPDNLIKEFLDKIKNKDVIFDNRFKEKIEKLYGSFENYKNPS